MTEYECPQPERYSSAFLRDWEFYVENRNHFTFSSESLSEYEPPKGNEWAIECFKTWDSEGKITPCGQPVLFAEVLRCKASVNLHIKMWAEGRADGTFPRPEFEDLMEKISAPSWVLGAVEKQAGKAWKRQKLAGQR